MAAAVCGWETVLQFEVENPAKKTDHFCSNHQSSAWFTFAPPECFDFVFFFTSIHSLHKREKKYEKVITNVIRVSSESDTCFSRKLHSTAQTVGPGDWCEKM